MKGMLSKQLEKSGIRHQIDSLRHKNDSLIQVLVLQKPILCLWKQKYGSDPIILFDSYISKKYIAPLSNFNLVSYMLFVANSEAVSVIAF